jgi:3-hydroxybutyryl-CoA dehydrogenase
MPIRTVAIIGAGTHGRDFALLCVSAGFHVILEDVMPAKLRRAEEAYISSAHTGDHSSRAGTLRLALTVEDAVRDADLAIDFVPDELESKLEIFCMIDRMAPPRTILLTPTDALSITDLASCTYRGSLCFGLRGSLNPVDEMPSAQIQPLALIAPVNADPAAARAVEQFLNTLGVSPTLQADADAPMLVKNSL